LVRAPRARPAVFREISRDTYEQDDTTPDGPAPVLPLLVRKCLMSVSGNSASSKKAQAHHDSNTTPSPTELESLATDTVAQLKALEAKLNLDIVVPPTAKNQMRAMKRVSDKALGLAADIVSSDPARFADFAGLPASAQHVAAMSGVALQANELATHVQKSVQNHRTPAAQQTLALYSVVKSLGRVTSNETMREKIPLLKAEVAPKRKNPKPRVTKEQKMAKRAAASQAKRIAKAKGLLAQFGEPATPPPQEASPPPPEPTAVPQTAPVAVPAATNGAPAPTATH
jgi:hypothetical protein